MPAPAEAGGTKRGRGARSCKAIVRRLPFSVTEHQFYSTVDALGILADVTWSYFAPGQAGNGYSRGQPTINPDFRHGRACLNFRSVETLDYFVANFAGYPFPDQNGDLCPCVAIKAPFQKIPNEGRKRNDTKYQGTIEQDPDYQEFIQQLSKDPEPMPTAEKLLELKEAEEKARIEAVEAEVTPLVAYMRKKRDEKARRMKNKKAAAEERKRKLKERQERERQRERLRKERDVRDKERKAKKKGRGGSRRREVVDEEGFISVPSRSRQRRARGDSNSERPGKARGDRAQPSSGDGNAKKAERKKGGGGSGGGSSGGGERSGGKSRNRNRRRKGGGGGSAKVGSDA